MKLKTDQLKDMIKSVVRGSKSYGEHNMMSPVREWYLGVGVCLVLVLVGGFFAVSTFIAYQNVSFYEAVATSTPQIYNEKTVKDALRALSERKERMATFEGKLRAPTSGPPALATGTTPGTPATTTVDTAATTTANDDEPVRETSSMAEDIISTDVVAGSVSSTDEIIPQLAF